MYIYLVDERVTKSWAEVLKKLKGIFGPDFKVFDEGYAHLDLSLLLIAWELQYVRNNFPEEQKEKIGNSILKIIEEWDNGNYSLAEVNDYLQMDSKDMSSRLLLRLIRDEKKFAFYKISEIDLRRTWEIIKSLTGVASFAVGMTPNDILDSISDSYYKAEALRILQNDPEYQALSKKLQELKDALPKKRTLASLKKFCIDSSAISTPLTTRKQIKLKPREPKPIVYQRENMDLPVDNHSSVKSPPTSQVPEKATISKLDKQLPFPLPRISGNLPIDTPLTRPVKHLTPVKKERLTWTNDRITAPIGKSKVAMDVPTQVRSSKRNGGLRGGKWMKNWKVPAVILALVCFGGYLALVSIYWGMGTTLFIGDFAYDKSDILDILSILWTVIMLVAAIWLLLVIPWKRIQIKLRSYDGMRNWKVPGIILTLLILAMAFRWSIVSSQVNAITSKISSTVKFQKDNWNSALYKLVYTTDGKYSKNMVNSPPVGISSESLTFVWVGLTGGSIIWLLYAVSKTKKKDTNENNSINT